MMARVLMASLITAGFLMSAWGWLSLYHIAPWWN